MLKQNQLILGVTDKFCYVSNLNASTEVPSGAGNINFGSRLYLHPCFEIASCKCSVCADSHETSSSPIWQVPKDLGQFLIQSAQIMTACG